MEAAIQKITHKTFSKLVKEDIVLPSDYYETFDSFAKEYKINSDENMRDTIDTVVKDEINKLKNLTDKTLQDMETFVKCTDQANEAINKKDTKHLKSLSKEVQSLQNNIESLLLEIYMDDLTKIYNKKWIYKKLLDSEDRFKSDGTLYLIQINNLEYIKNEYGELIANNIIRFITKLLKTKLEHTISRYDFCRYLEDKLIISHRDNPHIMEEAVKEMQGYIENSTLKSKSGVMIKASFSYSKVSYKAKDLFYDLLESLDNKITKE